MPAFPISVIVHGTVWVAAADEAEAARFVKSLDEDALKERLGIDGVDISEEGGVTEMTLSLRARVFTSCDRAVENGYVENFEGSGQTIYDCDPVVVTMDMLDTDADFENVDPDESRAELVRLVAAWQDARRPS
jgi:hypothetical protein